VKGKEWKSLTETCVFPWSWQGWRCSHKQWTQGSLRVKANLCFLWELSPSSSSSVWPCYRCPFWHRETSSSTMWGWYPWDSIVQWSIPCHTESCRVYWGEERKGKKKREREEVLNVLKKLLFVLPYKWEWGYTYWEGDSEDLGLEAII